MKRVSNALAMFRARNAERLSRASRKRLERRRIRVTDPRRFRASAKNTEPNQKFFYARFGTPCLSSGNAAAPFGARADRMLLTKRKRSAHRLLTSVKAARNVHEPATLRDTSLDHEKQLAVVDAVEWAVERWHSRDLALPSAGDPRTVHAERLIAALVYLDERFARLEAALVTQIIERVAIERVTRPTPDAASEPSLDAKAAAAFLAVEVGAFRR